MSQNNDDFANLTINASDTFDYLKREIESSEQPNTNRLIDKIFAAAIGNIPAIGIALSIIAAFKNDEAQLNTNSAFKLCHEVYQRKFIAIEDTLKYIQSRLKSINSTIDERIDSPLFLAILNQAFRAWDRAETDEKRRIVANLIANAASTRAASDDIIRLFISWIDKHHESHFALMKFVFQNYGCTRYEIYTSVFGALPREDSANADMFKLLIRDLSTDGIIRQERETTNDGRFVRHRQRRRNPNRTTLESAFEDTKGYALTELGKQFIHYVMNEAVTNIDSAGKSEEMTNSNGKTSAQHP